jgi:hypothetical protein
MEIRVFNEENLDKLDRLLDYLFSNKLTYGVSATIDKIVVYFDRRE